MFCELCLLLCHDALVGQKAIILTPKDSIFSTFLALTACFVAPDLKFNCCDKLQFVKEKEPVL